MTTHESSLPQSSGLTHRTLKGLLWTSWGKGANTVLQIGLLAVLARLLTPTEFGVVSAALVVTGLSDIFSQMGLGPALVQRQELRPEHLRTAFTASSLLGFALGAAVWLLSPLAARFLRVHDAQPILAALAWLFPMQGFGVVSESMIRRELRFRRLANIDIAALALAYGPVAILLARSGWGAWALAMAALSRSALRTILLVTDSRTRLAIGWEWRAFRELFYFGGGHTMAQVANYAALQGDNLTVARLLGPVALGLYGRAYQLMATPATVFGTVLDAVLFPAMAQVQDDSRRLVSAFRRGVALIALVVLPATPVVVVLAPEIITVLLGPRWSGAVAPFQVLAVGMLFRTSSRMSDSLTRATGAVYRRAWRTMLYAVLVLVGAGIGQQWGITGVAWGVLVALAINFTQMAQLGLRVTRASWLMFLGAHAPAALLAAATAPVTWFAAQALRAAHLPPVVVLAVAGSLSVLVSVVLIVFAPGTFLGPDGSWILRLVDERLRSRGHRGVLTAARRAGASAPDRRGTTISQAGAGQTGA